ncbi:DUF7282 domain-containing protein [Chthonobacter albigriseus]|uniref:DUF7282 domain-containing protein n=1 Tax=Chthonobacter albigriseus TaxID=1683161 RepID=UPI0015EEB1F2|nr:hypothetical protein [Chthonobacter albigriseus]
MTRLTAAAVVLAAATGFAGPALADHVNVSVDKVTAADGTVTFGSVKIDKDGFIVVHAVKDGAPVLPGNVGHAPVKAGTTENVAVPIEGLEAGGTYMVMLHYDTDGDGKYGFGEGMTDVDTPAVTPKNEPWMKEFKAGM